MRKLVFLWAVAALSLTAAEPGFLHRQGAQIVDAGGHPVTLRGTNLGNWLVPEGYMFLFENGSESRREIDAFFRDIAGPEETERPFSRKKSMTIRESDCDL